MRRILTRFFGAPHWPSVAATYLLGLGGGLIARALHLPLPMLLGSLLAVGGAAVLGVNLRGHLPQAPQSFRMLVVPIIGVSIGGAVTPEILEEAPHWLTSLAVLCVFVPAVHYLCFRLVAASGRTDRVTALYATAPGGLVETVQLGEEAGADVQMLAMLQFLRMILTIILVPLAFTWLSGHAVGSAGGAAVAGRSMGLADFALLGFAAIFGAVIGVRLRLPAGQILGPILLSGLVHALGWTGAAPPGWLINLAQIVIGTSLGVRFAGMPKRRILTALRLAMINVTVVLTVALLLAVPLGPIVKEPARAVFLAFAPGGLIEMGLIALSLNMSILYVTAHHLLRIILSVSFARFFGRRILR